MALTKMVVCVAAGTNGPAGTWRSLSAALTSKYNMSKRQVPVGGMCGV